MQSHELAQNRGLVKRSAHRRIAIAERALHFLNP
ncbi:hypothetical protein PS691_00977 [Pseudomonas fluorescens]|uniref:Uncharacterized protein n=1 Tax=Pseudomonas fluorescens TaxID=294 RepID=A0A5E7AKB8_PSEFL|nr:hypothetical protein PS691_00977 [Pseudomonas fluorescens]